jgi:adenylate cyclase
LLLRQHDAIVRSKLEAHDGREVKHTGDGIMASFNSVAVASGIAMQRALADRNANGDTPLHVSIGITAGEPITDERQDLFGAAVQLAARLCDAERAGDIIVSLAVRELCMGKAFQFQERAPVPLKGMPDPTLDFAVAWRS